MMSLLVVPLILLISLLLLVMPLPRLRLLSIRGKLWRDPAASVSMPAVALRGLVVRRRAAVLMVTPWTRLGRVRWLWVAIAMSRRAIAAAAVVLRLLVLLTVLRAAAILALSVATAAG